MKASSQLQPDLCTTKYCGEGNAFQIQRSAAYALLLSGLNQRSLAIKLAHALEKFTLVIVLWHYGHTYQGGPMVAGHTMVNNIVLI